MIGQAVSLEGKKYNVIILAAGKGTRMGEQSEYIPKALSKLGNKRAIDYIIDKYSGVSHKFIISTGYGGDLLESYILGKYSKLNIEFSRLLPEEQGQSNGVSLFYALDHANSRYGTIILFCDLIVVSNNVIRDDTILVTTPETKGNVGSFRHIYFEDSGVIAELGNPTSFSSITGGGLGGVLGNFTLGNTPALKVATYSCGTDSDITADVLAFYGKRFTFEPCQAVYEFGTENDLKVVRELWEHA